MSISSAAPPLSPADEVPDIAARAARSGGAMFIAKSVRFGFLLLVNFILINLLLPADFGMVRYVILIVGIASLLNEMGLTTAIVQKEQLDTGSLWSLFLISFLWGLMLYAVIFFVAPLLARFFAAAELTRLLRVGALMIPVAGISAVHRAWLRRRMEFGKLALIEMCAAAVSAIGSVILAFNGFGVWALIIGYLLFEGTISMIVFAICRIPVAALQRFGALRALLFFGMVIIVSRIVDYVLCNAPFVLIGKVIGKEGLGLFSVAYMMALFPQTAINAVLGHVLISTFSRIQTDDKKTAAGFNRLLLFGSVFAVPVLLVMAIMPYELLRVICVFNRNNAWLEAAPLLRWLALMGIPYVFSTFSNSVWLSRGKVVESIIVSLVIGLSLVISIMIGVQWGLTGVCIALLLQAVLVFTPYMYVNYLLTRVPVVTSFSAFVPSLAAGALMAIVLLAMRHLVPGDTVTRHFLTLLGGGVLGGAVYVVVIAISFRSSLRQLGEMVQVILPGLPRGRS
ncbi:MAG: lipopolysaccharide biosynthesis protein [Chitinispirillaceae bacterium]|nr:lipopolysaccharide biosynthesis protein [Chitinispirillaceae bacterium]